MLGLLRVRSPGWWGLVLCLSLAVGAYIVFDVLDIDGSDLQNRIFQDSLTPQTSLVEAERPLRLASQFWQAWGGISVALLVRQASTRFNPQFKSVPTAVRARSHGIISSLHVTRHPIATPRPADDPA
jgi:hypothetical protein